MPTPAQYECLFRKRTDIPTWWQSGGNIYDPAHYAQMASNWWSQPRAASGDESGQYPNLDAYMVAIGCGAITTQTTPPVSGGTTPPPSGGGTVTLGGAGTITERLWAYAKQEPVLAIGAAIFGAFILRRLKNQE